MSVIFTCGHPRLISPSVPVRILIVILAVTLAGCATYVEKDPRVRAFGEEAEFETAAQIAKAAGVVVRQQRLLVVIALE